MKFLTQGKTNWKFIIIFSLIAVILSAGILLYVKNALNYNYQQPIYGSYKKTVSQQTYSQNAQNVTLSYGDAVKKYQDRRIQFDPNCIPVPYYVVFKKGTSIMLDNRYNKARPIYLDGAKYNIGAYGFKIVTLTTTAKLPHTIRIDCGTGKNNGSIFLEQ